VFCSETAVAGLYLITIAIDMNEDRSYVAVFVGEDVASGPLATAYLPERISSGTHSFWAWGSVIPGWEG
jgi:carotenoid cleavage dioxygenase